MTRPVGVEDVVVLVHGDGLTVQGDGPLEVPGLTGAVALSNLLQEQGFIGLPWARGAPGVFTLKQEQDQKHLLDPEFFIKMQFWKYFDDKKL